MSKIDQIAVKVRTAQKLRWSEPELAEMFARSAVEDAEALGLASASLHHLFADVLKRLGHHAQAFREVKKALRLDPFHPASTLLADELARCLRANLRNAWRPVDDPAIPRLYALLSEGGATTLSCHLTMIRHAIATGQLSRALELAEAVAALYSDEPPAWSMLAEAAEAAGNEERAEQARLQLGLLGLVPGFRPPRWGRA